MTSHNLLPVVDVVTYEIFRVEGAVTLLDARPDTVRGPIEVLDRRVSFLTSHSHRTFDGYPGYFCTSGPVKWEGSAPSYPVRGLTLQEGDRFAVTFLLRAAASGDWEARGLRLRALVDGNEREFRSGTRVHHMIRRNSAAELPEQRPSCIPDLRNAWFTASP